MLRFYLIFPELFKHCVKHCDWGELHGIRFGTRDTWIPWERHNNHTPRVSGNLSSHSATLFCLCAFVIVVVLVIFIVNVFAYLRRPHKYHVKSNNNNNNRNRWSVEQERKTTKWTIEVFFFTTRFFFYRSFCFVIVFLLFSPLLIFSNCLPRTEPYRHWFVVVVVFTTDIVVVNITAVVVVAIIAVVALSMGLSVLSATCSLLAFTFSFSFPFSFHICRALWHSVQINCQKAKWKHDQKSKIVERHAAYT